MPFSLELSALVWKTTSDNGTWLHPRFIFSVPVFHSGAESTAVFHALTFLKFFLILELRIKHCCLTFNSIYFLKSICKSILFFFFFFLSMCFDPRSINSIFWLAFSYITFNIRWLKRWILFFILRGLAVRMDVKKENVAIGWKWNGENQDNILEKFTQHLMCPSQSLESFYLFLPNVFLNIGCGELFQLPLLCIDPLYHTQVLWVNTGTIFREG